VELISGYDRLSFAIAQRSDICSQQSTFFITYPVAEAKLSPINQENEVQMRQPYTKENLTASTRLYISLKMADLHT